MTTYFGPTTPITGVGVGGGGVGVGVGLGFTLHGLVNCPVGPEDSPEEEVTPGESGTCAGIWQVCADRSCTESTYMRIPSRKRFFIYLPFHIWKDFLND